MSEEKIRDIEKIIQKIEHLRQLTNSGYYAPIDDVVYIEKSDANDVVVIELDYPTQGDKGEYRVTVPRYWEEGRELVDFLNAMDIDTSDISTLAAGAVPVKRVDGGWELDKERLKQGDYLEVNDQYTKDLPE